MKTHLHMACSFALFALPALVLFMSSCRPHPQNSPIIKPLPHTAQATTPATEPATRPALGAMEAPRIVVVKSARELTLYDGLKLVKKYRCCTGSVAGDKEREGDRKTPQGQFFVCYKNPNSKYTRSLGLSYPNQVQALRGLKAGQITQQQYDALMLGNRNTFAFVSAESGKTPLAITRSDGVETITGVDWEALWKTPLGGEIMIHGAGATREGTAGCVGLDDPDILELYEAIPLGTPVVIRP